MKEAALQASKSELAEVRAGLCGLQGCICAVDVCVCVRRGAGFHPCQPLREEACFYPSPPHLRFTQVAKAAGEQLAELQGRLDAAKARASALAEQQASLGSEQVTAVGAHVDELQALRLQFEAQEAAHAASSAALSAAVESMREDVAGSAGAARSAQEAADWLRVRVAELEAEVEVARAQGTPKGQREWACLHGASCGTPHNTHAWGIMWNPSQHTCMGHVGPLTTWRGVVRVQACLPVFSLERAG